jgi:hypothetical protein
LRLLRVLIGGVGLVNIGVTVGVREPPTDDLLVDSDEADEPADETGEQLTPGVIGDDGLVTLVDLEPVALVPGLVVPGLAVVPGLLVVPVLPEVPVVCANAGAVIKASAHARPTPLRIGIFRILIKDSSFVRCCALRSSFRNQCNQPADFAATATADPHAPR